VRQIHVLWQARRRQCGTHKDAPPLEGLAINSGASLVILARLTRRASLDLAQDRIGTLTQRLRRRTGD
jgi:hypothetical protein